MYDLSAGNCAAYLESVGFLRDRQLKRVASLGGGISNQVLKIETSQGNFVLKQALPKLRVQAEWRADVNRIHRERDAIRLVGALFDGRFVPRVVFSDPHNHVLIITCAPEGARMWKQELLQGRVHLPLAAQLGELLARIHVHTHREESTRRLFASREAFDQLRVDPYYRTTAARHPDLGPHFERMAELLLTVTEALVHGDYSPKNILVNPEAGLDELIVLDFEGVHYGDPCFDTAFFLNHLFIKSMYVAGRQEDFFRATRTFWETYNRQVQTVGWTDVEARTVSHLGCLMLARVDGKSPLEYIQEEPLKERIRRVARAIIVKRAFSLARVERIINED